MHLIRFIKSVNHEMKLVVWPTAKENRRDTTIVVSIDSVLRTILLLCLIG